MAACSRLVWQVNYPALTRFTYTPNRKLTLKPIAGRDPQTEDLALQRCLIKGDVLDGVNLQKLTFCRVAIRGITCRQTSRYYRENKE